MSGVRISPDPAIEGQLVTIILEGSGPWYMARDPDGDLIELQPDANGEAEVQPPGSGGDTFSVTNFGDPPLDGNFHIVSTQ